MIPGLHSSDKLGQTHWPLLLFQPQIKSLTDKCTLGKPSEQEGSLRVSAQHNGRLIRQKLATSEHEWVYFNKCINILCDFNQSISRKNKTWSKYAEILIIWDSRNVNKGYFLLYTFLQFFKRKGPAIYGVQLSTKTPIYLPIMFLPPKGESPDIPRVSSTSDNTLPPTHLSWNLDLTLSEICLSILGPTP